MDRALEREGGRVLGVLEGAVRSLELLAIVPAGGRKPPLQAPTDAALGPETRRTLTRHFAIEHSLLTASLAQPEEQIEPETDDGEWDWHLDATLAREAFPKSLHSLLCCLSSDRSARDALREATSTSVSPAVARLALMLTQLAINSERALATSAEQDERSALSLRESLLRLREAEDDRKQVGFELAQKRDARAHDLARSSAQVASLETQLRELTRTADDVLADSRREREQELQAALSAFEAQQGKAGEQRAAIERGAQHAGNARVQREADDRKRKVGVSIELRELLTRYDEECAALDERIDREKRELRRVDEATRAIAHHFERIDADRAVQLDEEQAIARAERARKLREMNLFGFIQRLQAVVRGFLARKRVRLELLAAKKRRKKKKTGKKTVKRKTVGLPKVGKRGGGVKKRTT